MKMSWHKDHAILRFCFFFNQEQDGFKPINCYCILQHYAALLCATELEMHPAAGEQHNPKHKKLALPLITDSNGGCVWSLWNNYSPGTL